MTALSSTVQQNKKSSVAVQAMSEVVLPGTQVTDEVFSSRQSKSYLRLLHVEAPTLAPTANGLLSLDLSFCPVDNEKLCKFRDCCICVPRVHTLKLNLKLPKNEAQMPTVTLSHILGVFADLEELYLRNARGSYFLLSPDTAEWLEEEKSELFGKMLKNCPWLRVLDISRWFIFQGLRSARGDKIKQAFVDAVLEARHSSLQLNLIRIKTSNKGCGDWYGIDCRGIQIVRTRV
jgi:hypothetical protein